MPATAQAYRHVGEHIRMLRLERHLTQGQLAAKAGVNIATICLIEKGKRPGTVEVHGQLARALGLTLSELYARLEERASRPPTALQHGSAKPETYAHPGLGFAMQPLTSNVMDKRMMPILLQLEPRGATVLEQARADTQAEKFVYVQSGVVEVRVGDERFTLRKHETLYFNAMLPHQIKNIGKTAAGLFVVMSPPMF